MSTTRCCARCRTPYNCGNPSCACHLRAPGTSADVSAWAARYQEPTPAERFDLDRMLAARDILDYIPEEDEPWPTS